MNKDDQARIFTYFITSARGCIEEPPLYGPLRLLEAYSMLLHMLKREETDELYYRLDEQVENLIDKCMGHEKQFAEGLDQIIEILTDHIVST